MISIRIRATTAVHGAISWTCGNVLPVLKRDVRDSFSSICVNVSSFFSPLGRAVILEVKGSLIARLLPADRSTENLEARRIQRRWSVVICPLMDDSYTLPVL